MRDCDPRVNLMLPYYMQDGPDHDTAGSNVVRPVLGPDSSTQPRMSAFNVASFGFGRTSLYPSTDSDLETWTPACVTWREALAAAFPVLAAWPLSTGTPGGTAVRREFGLDMCRCCFVQSQARFLGFFQSAAVVASCRVLAHGQQKRHVKVRNP